MPENSYHLHLFFPLPTKVLLAMPNVAEYLSCTDNSGNTPLHIAVESNYEDAVNLLLTKNVDCNVANCLGRTPLHLAAAKGYNT